MVLGQLLFLLPVRIIQTGYFSDFTPFIKTANKRFQLFKSLPRVLEPTCKHPSEKTDLLRTVTTYQDVMSAGNKRTTGQTLRTPGPGGQEVQLIGRTQLRYVRLSRKSELQEMTFQLSCCRTTQFGISFSGTHSRWLTADQIFT